MALSSKITVTVDSDYVRRGTPRNPFACPIALAILDTLREDDAVSISDEQLVVTTNLFNLHYDVPAEAKKLIRLFDNDEPVQVPQTFTFRLRKPKGDS